MRWQRWPLRRDSGAVRDVIDEAQRILTGHAVPDSRGARNDTAAWGAVNRLAHSTFADYQRLVALRNDAHPGSWTATAGYLAVEVLGAAGDPGELLALQREVLVPLELRLLAGQVTAPTPARLAALVTRDLKGHHMPHDR